MVVALGRGAKIGVDCNTLGDNASIFDTLIMGGRTVVVSVVHAETPSAVFP